MYKNNKIEEVISPYLPLAMNVVNCLVDCRATFVDANAFLGDVSPGIVAAPLEYLKAAIAGPACATAEEAQCIGLIPPPHSYVVSIPVEKKIHIQLPLPDVMVRIPHSLAGTVILSKLEAAQNACIGRISGTLRLENGQICLEKSSASSTEVEKPSLWGEADIHESLKLLHSSGHSDAVISSGNTINIPSLAATMEFVSDSKCVVTAKDDPTMVKLNHILMKQVESV